MPPPQHQSGFTLIELSIVLVIIGLIVGGVLVGQDLILAAEMRSQVERVKKFEIAFNTFRLKYNCIPADCSSSKLSIFGMSSGGGDGNGIIDASVENENYATVHLYESGLTSYVATSPGGYLQPLGTSFLQLAERTHSYIDDGESTATMLWPTEKPRGLYWSIAPNEVNDDRDPELIFLFDNKYDDGNGLTGSIKIQHQDLDGATGCIDLGTGVYRSGTGDLNYCEINIDFGN